MFAIHYSHETSDRRIVLSVAILSILMLATRGAHFSGLQALPEASWMIFMIAGLLLPSWFFIWFMSLAVGIDAYAFSFGELPGTCFSIAYGMLIPAYFSMWIAGRLVASHFTTNVTGLAGFFIYAMVGTLICELISSGSFYLWSGSFEPTIREFVSRELRYAPATISSSAFWAVTFAASTTLWRLYRQTKSTISQHG